MYLMAISALTPFFLVGCEKEVRPLAKFGPPWPTSPPKSQMAQVSKDEEMYEP